MERRAERRLGEQRRSALGAALENVDLSTQSGQKDFLQRTISSGVPTQEALSVLDRAIASQKAAQQGFQYSDPQELGGLFERLGVEPGVAQDYAELYGGLSRGGRTAFANMFIDKLQRGEYGKKKNQSPLLSDVEPEEEGFVFPEIEMFEGLTPKERVGREKELFNANSKEFSELAKKRKGIRDEAVRVNQLQRFNESGRLPEGLEKLNINWKTGDIRFPALANAETQGFVKAINDFTIKAKDTFGARVTNFELASFMRRLPTMANSTEGRRLIIEQMKAMSDIDKLYYDSLNEVYDNYGLRNIDNQQAERIAADLRSSKEEQLKQKVVDAVDSQEIFELKAKLPEGSVLIEFEGRKGSIPASQIDAAIKKGAKLL